MKLQLKPTNHNEFELAGILIKGSQVVDWVKEIQRMSFQLTALAVYPIPNTTANSVWGCLLVPKHLQKGIDLGKNSYCQRIGNYLFIPEKSSLHPKVSHQELERLFWSKAHILHPEFGLVELPEALDWKSLLNKPQQRALQTKQPKSGGFIPKQVRSFQIQSVSPEEVIENLEMGDFPTQEKLNNEPLSLMEQARLSFYRKLFAKTEGEGTADGKVEKTSLMSMLESARGMFDDKPTEWTDEMRQDFEELERRNQHQLDHLMDMLKNNPEEALKYAIPLDEEGTGRGGFSQNLGGSLFKRWNDFSLFGSGNNRFSGDGSATISDDSFYKLQQQYRKTAEELIQKGEFKKAAFIYMKLLKNYYLAAQTLEKGKLYQEAAAIYQKYVKNQPKAAECYEKGNMIQDAIEVYKELGEKEKVGDLYVQIHQRKQANHYYGQVLEAYKESHQYLKAALLSKDKMEQFEAAQELLLTGWKTNRDAYNCLNNYFQNIPDSKQLKTSLKDIYQNSVDRSNEALFLRVIKHEFKKHAEHEVLIREMAHEIIVNQAEQNQAITAELQFFNPNNQLLAKDAMRYRLKRKRRP